MYEIIQNFKISSILVFYKNIFTLNNIMFINIKKYYSELNDINNMGFVFKVSDDIVYARGLLKVQMSEMVNLN
jgi:F0F1-type ATP synthase alpha subunit